MAEQLSHYKEQLQLVEHGIRKVLWGAYTIVVFYNFIHQSISNLDN